MQPVPNEYVIESTPEALDEAAKTPEVKPMLPYVAGDEVHEPPATTSDKVSVRPSHTTVLPRMADGDGLTVTVTLALQPEAT